MAAISQPSAVAESAGGVELVTRLKDATAAALLTVLLCVPIILLQAEADTDGVLHPIPRPWTVAIFALLAFFGRLAISNAGADVKKEARPESKIAAAVRAAGAKYLPMIGLAVLFLYPFVVLFFLGSGGSLKWVDSYGIQILIYVMLGWGLNIVVGLAGLLDLGYVAFYAVGAYSYALLATTFGLSFWICLPLAGILAALWGVMLGFPVLRLRGDYLAIVTLAFGEIIRSVLVNWVAFTGGGAGIASIPKITFFSLRFADAPDGFDTFFHLDYSPLHGKMFLYYVILCLALITNLVSMRLRRLPIGRAWEALREDEIACRSLGINTTNSKLTAFALGAFFGGLAGSFFSVRQGFISPESFTFVEFGDDSRHRGARRHGLADRRRPRGGVPDRRVRTVARTRFSPRHHVERNRRLRDLPRRRCVWSHSVAQARRPGRDRSHMRGLRLAGVSPASRRDVRQVRHARFRSRAISRSAVRPCDGRDDGRAAARLRFDAFALDLP